MKAIIKKPFCESRLIDIDNELGTLQDLVGGWIETVTYRGFIVICDEEGRLKGEPHCCTVGATDFVGTVLVVGDDGEDFCDVRISLDEWKWLVGEVPDDGPDRH